MILNNNVKVKNVDKDEIVVVARGVGGTGDVKICREDCFLTNLSIAFKVNEDINTINKSFLTFSTKI